MNKEFHFPNVGFVQQAFLYSVRILLTHPVQGNTIKIRQRGESNWDEVAGKADRPTKK